MILPSSQTSFLNSRLIYLTFYSTFPFECLLDILNSPVQTDIWFFPHFFSFYRLSQFYGNPIFQVLMSENLNLLLKHHVPQEILLALFIKYIQNLLISHCFYYNHLILAIRIKLDYYSGFQEVSLIPLLPYFPVYLQHSRQSDLLKIV